MRYTHKSAYAEHVRLFQKALALLRRKRADYSGAEDPFGNFRQSERFGVEPWKGALIRMSDKVSRMYQLMSTDGKGKVLDESLEDTVVDILNYAVIIYQIYKETK